MPAEFLSWLKCTRQRKIFQHMLPALSTQQSAHSTQHTAVSTQQSVHSSLYTAVSTQQSVHSSQHTAVLHRDECLSYPLYM